MLKIDCFLESVIVNPKNLFSIKKGNKKTVIKDFGFVKYEYECFTIVLNNVQELLFCSERARDRILKLLLK
jgi:hypothetical protein